MPLGLAGRNGGGDAAHTNWRRHDVPVTGRHTQPDPLGLPPGMNVYAYAYGSPYMVTDRDGLCPVCAMAVGGGIGGGIGAVINSGGWSCTSWRDLRDGVFRGAVGAPSLMWGARVFLISSRWVPWRWLSGQGRRAGRLLREAGRFAKDGGEIVVGKNLRIAPFGNRTGHATGRLPHYHRAKFNRRGEVRKAQGMKRHRPWDYNKDHDKSFWDRF